LESNVLKKLFNIFA